MDLSLACGNGDIDKVLEALKDGANAAWCNNYPIIRACEEGHAKIVELLLDNCVDPTVWENWPLRVASEEGYIDVVKALLQDGRVEVTDMIIANAKTEKIKEMLIAYKYRADGPEYCKMKK
jgi:hypothetical protein